MQEKQKMALTNEKKYKTQHDKLLGYSMELSMLARLKEMNLITQYEYQKIKINLMKEYHVLSDITVAITA